MQRSYIASLPEDRQVVINRLRKTALDSLPDGFEEAAGTMISYVVPYSLYPNGYHCPPPQPLPFLSIASQKNFTAVYHIGIYSDPSLLEWFTAEYPKYCKYKLDMGKSCIRFKRLEDIPYEFIGKLLEKITPDQWVAIYESAFVKK